MDFIFEIIPVILLFFLGVFILLALIFGTIIMTLSFFDVLRDIKEENNKK